MNLNNRQYAILEFIKKFIASYGYAPTVREIGLGVGLKSPSSVQANLKKLISEGAITMDNKKSRTIELLIENEFESASHDIVNIPLITEDYDGINKEYVKIPKFMTNNYDINNLYCMKNNNSIYLINASLRHPNKLSLVKNDNRYTIEENAYFNVVGNVISEFRVY